MNSQPDPNSREINAPHAAGRTVHVASRLDKATSWAESSPVNFGYIGLIWFSTITVWGVLSRLVPMFPSVFVAGVLLVGMVAWFIRRATQRKQHGMKSESGPVSDPAIRVRVVGHEPDGRAWVDGFRDEVFEPVIVRAWHGVTWERKPPERDDDGTISKQYGGKPTIEPDARRVVALVALIAVCFALVHMVRVRVLGHRASTGIFEAWSAAGLAIVISGWAFPVYVRVAPGVLDVFQFGPLGIGRPTVERSDLRQARVVVATGGSVRVEDESRAKGKVLFIDARGLIGERTEFARAVLAGARTSAPTPVLPMDELLG